jgi:hypothetical protein
MMMIIQVNMGKLIIPKTYVERIESPLIFLAGPIRSAPNWQDEAIKILFSQEPNLIIASPRRGIREDISEYILQGDENYFPRQRTWERHYLDIASKKGAILFWLPGEAEHNCEKVYGAMTRMELGQWITRYSLDNKIKICIGSDRNFQELDTIKYDLSIDAPDKKIFNSLEETCDEALNLAGLTR